MISVCMATRNGERFLREQIDSVLAQLDAFDELIVVDDNSADQTNTILQRYSHDPRVSVFYLPIHRGISKSFEFALSQASGEYIFLADQDDVWHPRKKEITLKYLLHHDLVVSDCSIVDQNLSVQHNSFFELNRSKKGFLNNLIKNSYMGCCMAFHRRLLKRALPFPDDIPMHDQWLGVVGELYFDVHFINEKLLLHRKHAYNASTTGSQSRFSFTTRMKTRIRVLKNILLHRSHVA